MNKEVTEWRDYSDLNTSLKDERKIQEFCNYVVFDGLSYAKAWIKTFEIEAEELNNSMKTKMYRWVNKPMVQEWLKKANKSLEVDWMDKKVDILQRMYLIATDSLVKADGEKVDIPVKVQATTGKDWLDAVKSDKTINLNVDGGNTVNIVQVVQDKLSAITSGATINPDGMVKEITARDRADEAIDAIILKHKEKENK